MNRIEEITARHEAATAGPWEVSPAGHIFSDPLKPIAFVGGNDNQADADAAFIAHARQDIPFLLDEIERLNAQLIDYYHMSKTIDGQQNQNKRLRGIIEKLTARAEQAERERDAAVEDIHEIDRFNGKCFRCKSWNGVRCKRGYSVNASFCNDWQWRGPQDEEGETHE